MPQITGLEIAQKIRVLAPGLPVILTTGLGSEIDIAAAGVYELLPKPFLLHSLSNVVWRALSRGN